MLLQCLAINPPYAELIMSGQKDVENRTWATSHRGPLAIYETKNGGGRGAVIGIVDVVGCVNYHTSTYFTGPWGFVLHNPRRIDPVPVRGKPGLFPVEIHFGPVVPE
jgi:hypothetical protein